MDIKGKVHCFFEQSGTFKNGFIKLGIHAEDYDIQNDFGETNHTEDLFNEIESAYDGLPSIFDSITKDYLIRIKTNRKLQLDEKIISFFFCN